jgi:hypothetical protein
LSSLFTISHDVTDPRLNVMLSLAPRSLTKHGGTFERVLYKYIKEMFHECCNAESFYSSHLCAEKVSPFL